MANPSSAMELHALGAESGAGQGAPFDIGDGRSAAYVTVRATLSTAALPITIETSHDGTTGWRGVGTPPFRVSLGSAAGRRRLPCDGLERYIRATWPATTAATFMVTAVAHQIYADRDDLSGKISRTIIDAYEKMEEGGPARSLIEASDIVADKLSGAWPLPMTVVPESIVGAAAAIAAGLVLNRHGFVGGGVDEGVVLGDSNARKWLDSLARERKPIAGVSPARNRSARISTKELRDPDEEV